MKCPLGKGNHSSVPIFARPRAMSGQDTASSAKGVRLTGITGRQAHGVATIASARSQRVRLWARTSANALRCSRQQACTVT